jgi:hypothetical protein
MLFQEEGGDAVVAIPQPGHAWLAGQLARAWGNDAFARRPAPLEEVGLGAEQLPPYEGVSGVPIPHPSATWPGGSPPARSRPRRRSSPTCASKGRGTASS